MTKFRIQSFIDNSRSKGKKDEDIKKSLLEAGWDEKQVLNFFDSDDIPPPPPPPPPNKIEIEDHSMWDAFQHTLMFISMGIYAVSMNFTLHTYVDVFSQDISEIKNLVYNYSVSSTFLKPLLAAIIVSYPIFAFMFIKIKKQTLKDPSVKYLRSRKRLIYSTLVVTFAVMLGNIIKIVYYFIEGNVSLNFVLHFLVPVIICGLIFKHYLTEVRGGKTYDQ
jgi:hypothetical protein